MAFSKSAEDPVGSFEIVNGDVLPAVVDILLGTRSEDEPLHPMVRFRSALRQRISAVDEFTPAGLFTTDRNLPPQFCQTKILQLLAFL